MTEKKEATGKANRKQFILSALTALTAVKDELCGAFLERESEVKGLLTALLAREHCLLLGPPGTAKSAISRAVCEAVEGARFFQRLLTKFSTPEELFGPISLASLEKDIVRRLTTNQMPEAHYAFLDEIFKANSAILNSLLTLINERLFYNGNGAPMRCPLWSVIGASNEMPDASDLGALYDRFSLRYWVSPLYDRNDLKALLMTTTEPTITATLTMDQLTALQSLVPRVKLSEAQVENILQIKSELEGVGIYSSDRRWRKAALIVRAYALLHGRSTVEDEDLEILEHMLWREPDQVPIVRDKVSHIAAPLLAEAREIFDAAEESYQVLLKAEGTDGFVDQSVTTRGVISGSRRKLDTLIKRAVADKVPTTKVEPLLAKVKTMQTDAKRRADLALD